MYQDDLGGIKEERHLVHIAKSLINSLCIICIIIYHMYNLYHLYHLYPGMLLTTPVRFFLARTEFVLFWSDFNDCVHFYSWALI